MDPPNVRPENSRQFDISHSRTGERPSAKGIARNDGTRYKALGQGTGPNEAALLDFFSRLYIIYMSLI